MTSTRAPELPASARPANRQPCTPEGRRRFASVAGHTGDERAARLAFADSEAPVRASGLVALIRLRKLTKADLAAAVADESALLRRRVGETAGAISAIGLSTASTSRDRLPPSWEDILACLIRMLDDPDAAVVEAACFGLGEVFCALSAKDDSQPTDLLVPKLCEIARNHPDLMCRESALAALGTIGSPDGLGAVLDAMGAKPSLRRRAVIALAGFNHPDARAALELALSDRDWQVRQAAEDLCENPHEAPACS